ncbi:MAG TPA: phage holin family protein [Pyrinomonadaceae bacterium]|nr:phage holin family protein [Pyrinomonadaceae bacterium]
MAAPRTSLTTNERADELATRTDTENLPGLFSRLGDDVMDLFNSQLALFKVEIKEEASAYARGVTMIAVGAVIAVVGFALLNVAIAFAVSTLFAQANFSQPASYALGFVVTGVFYLLVGGVVVLLMKNRLAKQELVPQRTVAELRKDKQWLKNEL